MNKYSRYLTAQYVAAAALALSFALIEWGPKPPNDPTIIILSLFGFALIASGYTYLFRCPNCKSNLNSSLIARVSGGNVHRCAKCGADLKSDG